MDLRTLAWVIVALLLAVVLFDAALVLLLVHQGRPGW
jgi:hypothetical protein